MNLKEAFRYQKFLDSLMYSAAGSIRQRDHAMKTVKTHLMKDANPEASDRTEEVVQDHPFFPNDDVIAFMVWLTGEKHKLSVAIGEAKAKAGFDIDAAVETNKFRQQVNSAVRTMLNFTESVRIDRGQSWKFNNEGNQTAYYYDVEVKSTEAFDREAAKLVARDMIRDADRVSADIDAALINLTVDYEPVFDVNESFDDVVSGFLSLS